MSMVSEALRNEETRAGGRRTVAGVVNSVETLGGLSCPPSVPQSLVFRV